MSERDYLREAEDVARQAWTDGEWEDRLRLAREALDREDRLATVEANGRRALHWANVWMASAREWEAEADRWRGRAVALGAVALCLLAILIWR